MNCPELVVSLGDFFEAEASLTHLEVWDGHLFACEDCGTYARSYLATISLVRWSLRLDATALLLAESWVDSVWRAGLSTSAQLGSRP